MKGNEFIKVLKQVKPGDFKQLLRKVKLSVLFTKLL